MTLENSYRQNSFASTSLTLDTIANAATFFAGRWAPSLKRNQSRDVLTAVINKLYGASRGSLFHSRMRCSHAALADSLGLSREWTCKMIGRLCDAGWLATSAPRLPDGKQEITIFRPGRMLKKLLVMLLKSKQRFQKNRVNDSSQKIPNKEEREKGNALFHKLIEEVALKLKMKT